MITLREIEKRGFNKALFRLALEHGHSGIIRDAHPSNYMQKHEWEEVAEQLRFRGIEYVLLYAQWFTQFEEEE